jgi:hypothetical protein
MKSTRPHFIWDARDASPDESFIILSDPVQVSHSYIGMFLQGSQGIELVCACVTSKLAFVQYMERWLEVV